MISAGRSKGRVWVSAWLDGVQTLMASKNLEAAINYSGELSLATTVSVTVKPHGLSYKGIMSWALAQCAKVITHAYNALITGKNFSSHTV